MGARDGWGSKFGNVRRLDQQAEGPHDGGSKYDGHKASEGHIEFLRPETWCRVLWRPSTSMFAPALAEQKCP
jgi:hypothetical protein